MILSNDQSGPSLRVILSKETRHYLLLALKRQREFETSNGYCHAASDEIARIIAWADGY